MRYFALFNLVPVFMFVFMANVPDMPLPILCGITLAFLCNSANQIMWSRAWPVFIIGTLLAEALLCFWFLQNVAKVFDSHMFLALLSSLILGSVFVAMIALRFNAEQRAEGVVYVYGLALCAALVNILVMLSWLAK